MIVIGIIGLLAVIAGSKYLAYIEKVRVASAVASIRGIQAQLDDYVRSEKPLPATLSEIRMSGKLDPWGHPFEYLPFPTTSPGQEIREASRKVVPTWDLRAGITFWFR